MAKNTFLALLAVEEIHSCLSCKDVDTSGCYLQVDQQCRVSRGHKVLLSPPFISCIMKYMRTAHLQLCWSLGLKFQEGMVQAVAVGILQRKARYAAGGLILPCQESSILHGFVLQLQSGNLDSHVSLSYRWLGGTKNGLWSVTTFLQVAGHVWS